KLRKSGDLAAAWRSVQRRGWEIFGLAFLFRLQSFLLSGGYDPIGLLKVDILNVMGPAIVVTALAGAAFGSRAARAWAFAIVAAAIAMATPIVRAAPAVRWMPDAIASYV